MGNVKKAGIRGVSRNQRRTPRKPAIKFAHLQKKMRKLKVQVKKPIGRKK